MFPFRNTNPLFWKYEFTCSDRKGLSVVGFWSSWSLALPQKRALTVLKDWYRNLCQEAQWRSEGSRQTLTGSSKNNFGLNTRLVFINTTQRQFPDFEHSLLLPASCERGANVLTHRELCFSLEKLCCVPAPYELREFATFTCEKKPLVDRKPVWFLTVWLVTPELRGTRTSNPATGSFLGPLAD